MISAVIVALLAGSSAVFATLNVSVSCAGDKVVTNVDNFNVAVRVTNRGNETLTLLNDPASVITPNWTTKTFHITNGDGVIPEFKGVAVSSRHTCQ